MIPYGQHYLDEDDIAAVVDVLRSGALTQGPKVNEFENKIAAYVGANFAVAVSSGTAALHLACLAANFKKTDVVFTSANTFVASANCVQYVGAKITFTDIDTNSLNMAPDDLLRKCAAAENVKGIIPVHFAGLSCDMAKIKTIADEYDAIVIEDASHALGGNYEDGGKIGNCKFSDMTTFSFHPVKGIAAGEGGMITTNNKYLYNKLLQLRSHGIYKGNFDFPGISIADEHIQNSENAFDNGELNPWYYEMQELGYNYRITDIQCALALSQLNKIDSFIERRRDFAARYDKAFSNLKYFKPGQLFGGDRSSHHIYVLRIKFDEIGKTRKEVMMSLAKQGVGSQVHYIPVPMHPYYEKLGFSLKDYKEVEQYYNEALTIPLYYPLTNENVNAVIDAVLNILSK